jgi:hypothetical protein
MGLTVCRAAPRCVVYPWGGIGAAVVGRPQDLKEGRETDLPLYDFRRSGRYAYLHVPPPESRVVIVEGTYALHERVRGLVDLAISVSGGVHFDLVKRIFRGTCTPCPAPPGDHDPLCVVCVSRVY